MYRILFIDDDRKALSRMRTGLHEYDVFCATEGAGGLELIRRKNPDLVLLDLGLPDMDGFEVLKKIKTMPDGPPVIILTGFCEPDRIVNAIKSGASDYVTKPYRFGTLRKIIKKTFLTNPNPPRLGCGEDPLDCVIGESMAITKVKHLVGRYADSDLPVCILGESGTGKELVAATLHTLSPRHDGPFVARNCGALPLGLLESELLGSHRGAYTDARDRAGCFEQAHGGTLFLDEIGEMDPLAQVKLLRVLESGQVTRLGATSTVSIDVRVVSATNKDLLKAVNEGSFRDDLYYRLNILAIPLPPLRERKEDIPLLAMEMLRRLNSSKGITSAACEKLQEYSWPGNVRELRNVVARAELHAAQESIGPQNIMFDEYLFMR